MHHKFAIADQDLLLTGSYNWTRSAATENDENIVVTNNPRLVRSFAGKFGTSSI
jgi:phosphatidylserine/phosphatidylglycerophosphate/cardiolipin synthase-like enzyme